MTSAAEDRTMLKDTILSKTWRMLRVVSKSNLAILDELGEGRQLDDYMVPQIGSMEVRALAEGAD